jgi:hypothetical protein
MAVITRIFALGSIFRLGVDLPDLFRQADAVELGNEEVGHDEVEGPLAERLQSLRAVIRSRDFEAGFAQQVLQELADGRIVVDAERVLAQSFPRNRAATSAVTTRPTSTAAQRKSGEVSTSFGCGDEAMRRS